MSSIPQRSMYQLTMSHGWRRVAAVLLLIALVVAAWATRRSWLQIVTPNSDLIPTSHTTAPGTATESDDEHDHDHAGHSEESSIELSENALRNIGFLALTVELRSFERTMTIPAVVVGQPGRTEVNMTTPLTGVVTKINVVRGEAIEPDTPMFEVRLTHEGVISAERDYLQAAENLDVVNREIQRLQSLGEGVIAGKRILEQKYEKQKLEATLRALEQSLLLSGLSEEQVRDILTTRKLLRLLTIRAPQRCDEERGCRSDHLYHVQSLPVSVGQQVLAGEELAVLADHCELSIEALAFEGDADLLRKAAKEDWEVTATMHGLEDESAEVKGLKFQYLADEIDPESRAFRAYLPLANEVLLERTTDENRRFVEWRFKPGQRLELRVPVERWKERIVLPVDAVVDEGAEAYVYRQNGDHFDRVPVYVEYRNRDSAVIANNGALFPGDVVAGAGAYQIHLALKNKAGGGVDPHAGHSH